MGIFVSQGWGKTGSGLCWGETGSLTTEQEVIGVAGSVQAGRQAVGKELGPFPLRTWGSLVDLEPQAGTA